jgi:hypothetical protein
MGWFANWKQRRAAKRQAAQLTAVSPESKAAAQEAFGGQFAVTSTDGRTTPAGYLTPITGGLPGMVFYDSEANIDRLLMASAWSWAAITGNAKAISQLVPVVQEKVAGNWVKAPPEHPLWAWIDDPLGVDDTLPYWPYSQLSYVTSLHYYIVGNAWWVPDVVRGDLVSVTPILNPGRVTATEDTVYGVPTEYRISSTGGDLVLSPEQMVNIMAPSAGSFWRGSSALRAALVPVDTDAVATVRQNANLNNHLGMGLILSTKGPLGPNSTQRAALKAELLADFREAVNQNDPYITGGDMNVAANPLGSPELQVFETKQFSRTEILAVIGMPPTVAGILDKAILNNFGVSITTWWHTHLIPVIEQQLGTINAQIVRRLYGPDTRLGYSVAGTDVGLQLMSAKLEIALKLQTLGYATNDINEQLRLEMPLRDYLNTPNQALLIAGREDPTVIAPADEPNNPLEEDDSDEQETTEEPTEQTT